MFPWKKGKRLRWIAADVSVFIPLLCIPLKTGTVYIKVLQLPIIFSGLSYCALLHNTRVCKRNEYYFGGSRELMFSCSYEATVTKTHCLRRFSLIPR